MLAVEVAIYHPYNRSIEIPKFIDYMPDIIIYTSKICPYCIMAKKLLDRKNAKYKEINVDGNPELREEMTEKTRRRTVPQIFIGEYHVGGFEELYALEQKRELDKLLTKETS